MKRKLNLEQFFTTERNVNFCLSKLNLNDFDLIVEPSAGDGAFSNKLNCIAYDIEPKNDKIIKQDYLQLDISQFKNKKVLVIGNPPFGRQSSLAIKFINKSALFADTIAFILSKSFKKESLLNKLNEHLHLIDVFELPEINFYFEDNYFQIPCSFFIFKWKEETRKKEEVPIVNDFIFCKKEEADNSVRRVGFYAGKIEELNVSESSHYFIKWNTPNAKENFSKLKFDYNNTIGARSISKTEFIKKYYEEYLDQK